MTRVTLKPNAKVSRPDSVLVRELGGELVLLNLDSESYFGLDEVGARMWHELLAGPTVEAACERLLAEFDVEPAQLRADLDHLVWRLREAQLIQVLDA